MSDVRDVSCEWYIVYVKICIFLDLFTLVESGLFC